MQARVRAPRLDRYKPITIPRSYDFTYYLHSMAVFGIAK